jgi:hypothetical protein
VIEAFTLSGAPVFNTPAHDESQSSLPRFLASEARRATDGQLALAATFGGVVAAVALLWHPDGFRYFLTSGLTCGAFGLWGILDRMLAEQGPAAGRRVAMLRAARFVCGLVGALAGAALLMRVLFVGLGTWIS